MARPKGTGAYQAKVLEYMAHRHKSLETIHVADVALDVATFVELRRDGVRPRNGMGPSTVNNSIRRTIKALIERGLIVRVDKKRIKLAALNNEDDLV